MSKEHIEELLRKVSQSNNDDYLALTIGSLFSDMEQQNKSYREAIERVKDSIPLEFDHDSEYEAKKNVIRLINIQSEVDKALESDSHD